MTGTFFPAAPVSIPLTKHHVNQAAAHGRPTTFRKKPQMPYLTAIIASIISLGAVCALYSCRVFLRPDSWLRGEMLDSILISLLSSSFPFALGASFLGLRDDLSNDFSLSAVRSAGLDFIALFVVGATFMVFLALVRTVYREAATQSGFEQSSDQDAASSLLMDRAGSSRANSAP